MESHRQVHKCIIVKAGEKKLTPLVQGKFKMNLPTPSAVIIISPYSHAGRRGRNPGKLELAFFSFANPTVFVVA